MDINTSTGIDKLNRIANFALFHQIPLLLLVVILFAPYQEIGFNLGLFGLVSSFISSRIYIRAGKKVEELMTFSPEENEERQREYIFRFISPYLLWAGVLALFLY